MIGSNPFVGPSPLETGQRIFGRDREIDELYYLLSAERIVLLHSPSGAGKSSLIRAGLIPRLAERFDVRGPTRVNTEPAGGPGANRYVRSANLGFEQGLPEERRREDAFVSRLTLAEYVESRPRRRSAPQNVVLIFDQFEEILTADPLALDAKREFFRQLGDVLKDPTVWALFALREDYLAALDPYATQVPTHLKNRFRLDLLSRDAARIAIAETAAVGGRVFAPDAVDKLVTDLATMQVQQPDGTFQSQAGPHTEPLHLQVACRGLWDLMQSREVIELADVERHCDVSQALAVYYAATLRALPEAERAIREWIGDKLITPGGIRGQVLRGAGSSEGLDNKWIAKLVDAHLVRAEQRTGAVWYELAHDRLIDPIRKNNAVWFDINLTNFQRRARQWKQSRENADLLLLTKELNSARCETPDETRFLTASRAERGRRRRWVYTLAIFGAALAALATYSLIQRERAEETLDKNRTFVARGLILDAYNHSRDRPDEALAYLEQALLLDPNSNDARNWLASLLMNRVRWLPVRQDEPFEPDPSLKIERVRDRVGDVVKIFEEDRELASVRDPNHPDSASLAGGWLVTGSARRKTGIAWQATGLGLAPRRLQGPVSALAFPNEDRLVVVSGKKAEVIDPRTAAPGRPVLTNLSAVLAVSADGRLAAGLVKANSTSLQIVEVETGIGSELPYRSGQTVILSPKGRYAAIYSNDGLEVWETQPAAQRMALPGEKLNEFQSVAFSDDAGPKPRVAVGWRDRVEIFDAGAWKRVGSTLPAADVVEGVALSPRGDRLAVVTRPGFMMVYDSQDLARTTLPMMDGNPLLTPAFGAYGTRLLTRSPRAVRLWDATVGQAVSVNATASRDNIDVIAMTPEADWAAYGTEGGIVRIIRLSIDADADADLASLAAVAGGLRLDKANRPQPIPLAEWISSVNRLRASAAANTGRPKTKSFLRGFLSVPNH